MSNQGDESLSTRIQQNAAAIQGCGCGIIILGFFIMGMTLLVGVLVL